ncbi:hypothetical protein [Gallaecimonas xiamenensis]|uniref:Uncharacterized protein n=1 Tax=Gallaecimonas xiamenensis 3-C-1 TaxID=745411 RepID=K2KF17_9GAMM|nr:hypothetical protein [Gallaecimonas xiamenensis]EKE75965.1 hypothetical protein B3C1_05882 [Gallaecimonas xiamenensis 3-C-1]
MASQSDTLQQRRLARLAAVIDEPGISHRGLLIWSYRTLVELLEDTPVQLWDEDRDPRRRIRK